MVSISASGEDEVDQPLLDLGRDTVAALAVTVGVVDHDPAVRRVAVTLQLNVDLQPAPLIGWAGWWPAPWRSPGAGPRVSPHKV